MIKKRVISLILSFILVFSLGGIFNAVVDRKNDDSGIIEASAAAYGNSYLRFDMSKGTHMIGATKFVPHTVFAAGTVVVGQFDLLNTSKFVANEPFSIALSLGSLGFSFPNTVFMSFAGTTNNNKTVTIMPYVSTEAYSANLQANNYSVWMMGNYGYGDCVPPSLQETQSIHIVGAANTALTLQKGSAQYIGTPAETTTVNPWFAYYPTVGLGYADTNCLFNKHTPYSYAAENSAAAWPHITFQWAYSFSSATTIDLVLKYGVFNHSNSTWTKGPYTSFSITNAANTNVYNTQTKVIEPAIELATQFACYASATGSSSATGTNILDIDNFVSYYSVNGGSWTYLTTDSELTSDNFCRFDNQGTIASGWPFGNANIFVSGAYSIKNTAAYLPMNYQYATVNIGSSYLSSSVCAIRIVFASNKSTFNTLSSSYGTPQINAVAISQNAKNAVLINSQKPDDSNLIYKNYASTVKTVSTGTVKWYNGTRTPNNFAINLKNVPKAQIGQTIYVRPYYYLKDSTGNETYVYGSQITIVPQTVLNATYNDYKTKKTGNYIYQIKSGKWTQIPKASYTNVASLLGKSV